LKLLTPVKHWRGHRGETLGARAPRSLVTQNSVRNA